MMLKDNAPVQEKKETCMSGKKKGSNASLGNLFEPGLLAASPVYHQLFGAWLCHGLLNCFQFCLVIALGGFLFGFDTAVISGAEQSIQQYWSLNTLEHGLTVSIACWIEDSVIASMLEVASSRISTAGSLSSARAIAMRCFSPPESR